VRGAPEDLSEKILPQGKKRKIKLALIPGRQRKSNLQWKKFFLENHHENSILEFAEIASARIPFH
jgi:hypothetical protein